MCCELLSGTEVDGPSRCGTSAASPSPAPAAPRIPPPHTQPLPVALLSLCIPVSHRSLPRKSLSPDLSGQAHRASLGLSTAAGAVRAPRLLLLPIPGGRGIWALWMPSSRLVGRQTGGDAVSPVLLPPQQNHQTEAHAHLCGGVHLGPTKKGESGPSVGGGDFPHIPLEPTSMTGASTLL